MDTVRKMAGESGFTILEFKPARCSGLLDDVAAGQANDVGLELTDTLTATDAASSTEGAKRRRGRPRKVVDTPNVEELPPAPAAPAAIEGSECAPRKRGRPRKERKPVECVNAEEPEVKKRSARQIGRQHDNPKLVARPVSGGRESLRLDFYFGTVVDDGFGRKRKVKDRASESLGLYLWTNPRNRDEVEENRYTLELAERIRRERETEVAMAGAGYMGLQAKRANVIAWMRHYVEGYNMADVRMLRAALNALCDFLTDPAGRFADAEGRAMKDRKEAYMLRCERRARAVLRADELTKPLMREFMMYLQKGHNGEGAHSYFARVKKMINAMVEAEVITKNPCQGLKMRVDDRQLRKEVLTLEEIQRLVNTTVERGNQEVRRAFLFSCFTGVRYCDVKDLTYGNVDFSAKRLTFDQSKTKGHSAHSGVVIPLSGALMRLIGEGERDEKIFKLPSAVMCNLSVQRWVALAGIEKHITWHCARHSFAVNVLTGGANIKTVASLLGHSGLSCTEKYTRVVDSLKQEAINSLPEMF